MALPAGKQQSVAKQQGSVPSHYVFTKSHKHAVNRRNKTEAGKTHTCLLFLSLEGMASKVKVNLSSCTR